MIAARVLAIAGLIVGVAGAAHEAEQESQAVPTFQVDVAVTPQAPGAVYIPPEPPEGRSGASAHFVAIQVVDRSGLVRVPAVPTVALYGGQTREGEERAGGVVLKWRAWVSDDLSRAAVTLGVVADGRPLLRQSLRVWLTDELVGELPPDPR